MYKLSYFYAANIIGFVSGLGKESFELDLKKIKKGKLFDKTILLILGDNATGKSTFLSLIHPMNFPSDDRQKFVVPKKDGLLIRKYLGDDGTLITTECIYKAKNDTHNSKCYFRILRPGEKEETELNPSGNVKSYHDLVYTYFGVNKDYVNFASYSDALSGIVKMNATERKKSVATLIPNTARFELAYNTVNEKYRELNNMIRNLSQKIMMLRDEETLEYQIKEVNKQIAQEEKIRDDNFRKLSKAEGRIKELRHGKSMEEILQEHKQYLSGLIDINDSLKTLEDDIIEVSNTLGLKVDPSNLMLLTHSNQLTNTLQELERKTASLETKITGDEFRLKQVLKSLDAQYDEYNKARASLVGTDVEDIGELKEEKVKLEKQLRSLSYSNHKELYENLSYEEIIPFSQTVAMLDQMIQSLYDEHGDLVSKYFKRIARGEVPYSTTEQDLTKLQATIVTSTKRKDEIYRKLIEKEQYRNLQEILEKRPVNCKIDDCPFIVNALRWKEISAEIDVLKKEYQEISVDLKASEEEAKSYEKILQMQQAAVNVVSYINTQETLLRKYLSLSVEALYKAISNGTWNDKLDMKLLKQMTVILSEKNLYNEITTKRLPEINKAIEIAEIYGSNRAYIHDQMKRMDKAIQELKQEETGLRSSISNDSFLLESYSKQLKKLKKIKNALTEFQDKSNQRIELYGKADKLKEEIETIRSLQQKASVYEHDMKEADHLLKELRPRRERIMLDRVTLATLKADKAEIEHDFVVVEVMRMIIQPGKGLRKELINLYMYDIFQLANDLLLNTFNGRLYLKEFIIEDDAFVIPYVYNGTEGTDIAYASSSQQSTISMALSLAIISKLIDKYGVLGIDEADKTLSAENKAIFVDILAKQLKLVGINQSFIISHSPEFYESYDVGILAFPGAKFSKKNTDYYEVV